MLKDLALTRVSEAQSDGAVRANNLEEHREHREGILVGIRQSMALHDGYNKHTQEHIPQVEGQLSPQMLANVTWILRIVRPIISRKDAQRFLFIDVRPTH